MLRLGPKSTLRGADLASMDQWSQRHGRDPRSQKKDGWLDEAEQATLFRWLARNERHHVVSDPVRRGASRQYKLDFGTYQGYRLGQLVQHSMSTNGQSHLLPEAMRPHHDRAATSCGLRATPLTGTFRGTSTSTLLSSH
jgi:hypothetical protein